MPDPCVRSATLVLLAAADVAFVWMFLSTDPLVQLATETGAPAAWADAALGFAADWRHGMAGNSWVYMPGFFVTAAALWLHARHAPPRQARTERLLAGFVALVCAFVGARPGSYLVVESFVDATGVPVGEPIPAPSAAGAFSGLYTLLTWSVFVLACRHSLMQRALRPFVAPAILSAGLVILRPWTVDDFLSHWAAGVSTGSFVARLSLVLVFVLAAVLAAADWPSAKPQPRKGTLRGAKTWRDANHEVSSGRDDVEAG